MNKCMKASLSCGPVDYVDILQALDTVKKVGVYSGDTRFA